jgi:hypothetical protein
MDKRKEATAKEFSEAQWSLTVLDTSGETRKQRDAAIPFLYHGKRQAPRK